MWERGVRKEESFLRDASVAVGSLYGAPCWSMGWAASTLWRLPLWICIFRGISCNNNFWFSKIPPFFWELQLLKKIPVGFCQWWKIISYLQPLYGIPVHHAKKNYDKIRRRQRREQHESKDDDVAGCCCRCAPLAAGLWRGWHFFVSSIRRLDVFGDDWCWFNGECDLVMGCVVCLDPVWLVHLAVGPTMPAAAAPVNFAANI